MQVANKGELAKGCGASQIWLLIHEETSAQCDRTQPSPSTLEQTAYQRRCQGADELVEVMPFNTNSPKLWRDVSEKTRCQRKDCDDGLLLHLLLYFQIFVFVELLSESRFCASSKRLS